MFDGYSERDSKASKSPWQDGDNKEKDHESSITRAGWGDNLAPLAQNMKPVDNSPGGQDPNANGTNGQKPWRAGFGGVAPAASNLPIDSNAVAQDTNRRNGDSPWRAGFGGSDGVARGAQNSTIDASSPDRPSAPAASSPWKAGYPDSTYKGPSSEPVNPAPSPWQSQGNSQPWRPSYPDSTYKGPDAVPAQQATSDWGAFARQQMAQQQQQQPGGRPTEAPGAPSNPGLNNVTDQQRQYIENSLHLKTSMLGYLGTGAITGASIGAAEWYMDKKLLSTIHEPHSGLMGWWETHSPLLKERVGMTARVDELEAAQAVKNTAQAMARDTLNTSAAEVNSLLKGLNTRVTQTSANLEVMKSAVETADDFARIPATQQALKQLQAQQAFLANPELRLNAGAIANAVGTPEEVAAGAKLFERGSQEANALLGLSSAGKASAEADRALKNLTDELDRTQKVLKQSVEEGAGSLKDRAWSGAVKGLAVAGGTLAAGYAMDKLGASIFGYKQPQTDGMGRFLLDGVAVPAVLLSDMPARYKFALAGSAFLSARAADYFSGTGASVQMSTLLRPNTCDGVLMTAAAMAPVDGKTKAALVAGAWGIGRVYNEVAHLTGLDGGAPAALRDDSANTFNHDQLTRTESTFDSAVEKGKKLGKENEAALELQMRDWLSKQGSTNAITHMRGTAVIADALGQFRLEEGSRFDLTTHADKKPRILKGYDYDFGGEATTWLRMAAGSLVSAQNFVASHKGQTIDGQSMDDAYIQQMKNEQGKVEAQLNKVYGSHNMQGIFDELTNQARVNSGDMQQALVRMKNQLDVLNSNDTRFVAKCCRDLAVGYLAEAAYMNKNNNGEEARIMYQAAVQYLQRSEGLDGNAPDNKALETIQSTVAKDIPGAISNQYNNRWNNPFQLNTPNYGTLGGNNLNLGGNR